MWKPRRFRLRGDRKALESIPGLQPSSTVDHAGSSLNCDISADGTKVLSTVAELAETDSRTSGYNTLGLVTEAGTGNTLLQFGLKESSFKCAALAPDADTLLTGSSHGTVILWDALSGEERVKFSAGKEQVNDVTYSINGDKIASAGDGHTARVWYIGPWRPHECACYRSESSIYGVHLSADANLLYVASGDKMIHAWEPRCGKAAFSLKGHRLDVTSCSVSRDGFAVVSCSLDGTVKLWDTRKRAQILEKEKNIDTALWRCNMTSDGRRVVVCGEDGKALFFNTQNEREISYLRGSAVTLRSCAISDTGEYAVTAGDDGLVRFFDLSTVLLQSGSDRITDVVSSVSDSETDLFVPERNRCSREIEEVYKMAIRLGQLRLESFESCSAQQNDVLTPMQFVLALRDDRGNSNILTWTDFCRAHITLRTILDYGLSFSDNELGGPLKRNEFFYDNIYSKLSTVIQSQYEKILSIRILDDAVQHGMLTQSDRNIIYGDIQVMQETASRFSSLQDVIVEMYNSITSRLSALESVLDQTAEALEELKRERNREKRIALVTGWAKLGLSLIPIAGPVAMSVAGMTGEVLLSFSPKDIIEMCTGLLTGVTDVAVELVKTSAGEEAKTVESIKKVKGDRTNAQTEYAVRLVELALSEAFLGKIDASDRKALVSAIQKHYGENLDVLRKDAHDAVEAMSQGCIAVDALADSDNHFETTSHDMNNCGDKNDSEFLHEQGMETDCPKRDTRSSGSRAEFTGIESCNEGGISCQLPEVHSPNTPWNSAENQSYMHIVKSLTVDRVAELMSNHVCEKLCEENLSELRDRVCQNVKRHRISGRGLMSKHISKDLVARTILYGHVKNGENLENDFMYLELADFIRELRSGDANVSSLLQN